MATNLFDLALERETAARVALTAAQAAWTIARSSASDARKASTAAAQALLDAETALQALRQQRPDTPAALAALGLALRDATVAQRSALAFSLRRQAEGDAAAAAEAAAERAVQAAEKALSTADVTLARERKAHEQRRSLIDEALDAPPLSTLPADAAAALAGADFAVARDRINNALPTALRQRARERAAQAAQLARVRSATVEAVQEAVDVAAAPRAELQRALAAADAALLAYASAAPGRLAAAQATLTRLKDMSSPPLSAAQATQLNDLQGTARPDAAAAEQARDGAALTLAEAAAELQGERIRARLLDPVTAMATMEADTTNHPDLAAARDTFDTAQTEFDTADAAFTTAMAATLARWQAEVPEPLWEQASAFWAAEDALQALSAPPAALLTALAVAEGDLLAELEAAAPDEQRDLAAAVALTHEQACAAADALTAAELSAAALRGPLVFEPWIQGV